MNSAKYCNESAPVAKELGIDIFTAGYLCCMLATTRLHPEHPSDDTMFDSKFALIDLSRNVLDGAQDECRKFREDNKALFDLLPDTYTEEQAGYDLFFERNSLGVGYFDRGLGEIGKRLSEAAGELKSVEYELGDDGKIH